MPIDSATVVLPGASTAASDSTSNSTSNYKDYVNPQWVSLLNLLGMNVEYERCLGCELFTKGGRRVLDFLSGYCVHNTGHNHPYIVQALKDEMDRCGPAMLQSHVSEIAGDLARRLCELAGGHLEKVCFGSSGSESVEAAIKFARATTGRAGIVYAKSSFHGLTAGALSLMNDAFWREGFGPLLPDTHGVPYGDIAELETTMPHLSWSPFKQKAAFMCPRAPTCSKRKSCAGARARFSSWMKYRQECIAPELFWRRTNLMCNPTWWCWPRRSAAA